MPPLIAPLSYPTDTAAVFAPLWSDPCKTSINAFIGVVVSLIPLTGRVQLKYIGYGAV